MALDLAAWQVFVVRMVLTVGFVVLAARAAERGGPLIGAMVATLPLSAAPAYVFLAVDHDSMFIAQAALGSLSANAATVTFCSVYAVLAQSRGPAVSLTTALIVWFFSAVAGQRVTWTLTTAIILNLFVFVFCGPLVRSLRHATMPAPASRRYDLPIRAGLVTLVVALVTTLSSNVGPRLTGALAVFPIVLTSLALILHPRIGGPATASITANAIIGLAGYAAALVALSLLAVSLGSAAALALALVLSMAWNIAVLRARDHSHSRDARRRKANHNLP